MTADLRPHVLKFVEQYKAEHPAMSPGKRYSKSRADRGFGATQYLTSEIVGKDVPNCQQTTEYRKLTDIVNGKGRKYVAFAFADKLLTAMEMSYLLHTDIPVVPNPMWGQEKWQAWHQAQSCSSE